MNPKQKFVEKIRALLQRLVLSCDTWESLVPGGLILNPEIAGVLPIRETKIDAVYCSLWMLPQQVVKKSLPSTITFFLKNHQLIKMFVVNS